MRSVRILWLVAVFGANCGFAATYRTLGDNFLDPGNRWEYLAHVTVEGTQSVDLWGTQVVQVIATDNIGGYDCSLVQFTDPSGAQDWECWYLTPEYLVEVGSEDEDYVEVVRDDDPTERFAVWVSDTDNNRHVGHGLYVGWPKENPSATWTGHDDSYVTFLGQETVTVPAGAFHCVVVLDRYHAVDDDGWHCFQANTFWFHPQIGIVKLDYFEWEWDPIEGEHIEAVTWELVWTNVIPGPAALTVETAGAGTGTVQLNPPGGTYVTGTSVSLAPAPGSRCAFDHWSGDVPAGHEAHCPLQLIMDRDRTIVAHYYVPGDVTGPGGEPDGCVNAADLIFVRNRMGCGPGCP